MWFSYGIHIALYYYKILAQVSINMVLEDRRLVYDEHNMETTSKIVARV